MKKILSVILSVILVFGCLSVSALAAEEKPFYVVLGDSIAYGSGLSNPKTACYGKIIADTNGYDYVNHAIPGHTTARLIGRLEEQKVIDDVKKADIISISIGGNDFLMNNLNAILFGYMVKGDVSGMEKIAEGFYKNFTLIMDIIRENNEDALILMQTLYNPQFETLKAPFGAGGDALNKAIVKYAEENPGEIVIVDVGAILNGDEANFASDGIHPSAKGNELIAEEIAKTLYELNISEATTLTITEKGEDFVVSPIFSFQMELTGKIFTFLATVYSFLTRLFNC